MGKRFNRNYEIINAMQLNNQFGTHMEVVMGYNEKAASPYVTWQYYPSRDSYENGNYFSSKEGAIKDFFERGMGEMGLDMRAEYRKENAIADIENVLAWEFNEEQTESLLRNESFAARAIHAYDNIDHSEENEALRDNVENIYDLMVERQEIFSFEYIDALQGKNLDIELKDGKMLEGLIHFNPKQSMSEFFVEVSKENAEPGFEYVGIPEIEKMTLDGQEIFPHMVDFDKTIESSDKLLDSIKMKFLSSEFMMTDILKEYPELLRDEKAALLEWAGESEILDSIDKFSLNDMISSTSERIDNSIKKEQVEKEYEK